ncbi:unnamed protein product [Caenorhabditis auriculariae]|uniref:DUF19 domain-containing protein n=1 Tax=Caenorhabditis auriculariae TaxID=2777116 RepID=A0A8S1GWX9_9PELO|nr:unnamed protein product [Caenorhabditis auriculariae]
MSSLQYVLSLLVWSSTSALHLPQPCFLKCKDNYMNGMQDDMGDFNEWTTDMVTPLHALLKSGKGRMMARLTRACRRNDEYTRCLELCPNVPAKQILIKGQNVWHILCHDFKNETDFRTTVAPCWSEYGEEITEKCDTLAAFLKAEILKLMQAGTAGIAESMDSMCKSVYGYDRCFMEENFEYCGPSAAKFLVKLNHQSSHTLLQLLDDTAVIDKLPKSCKDWINQKIAALAGEDEMSGPPPVQPHKSRFRNGHASFRLRMLQEQHGSGFEPTDKHMLKPSSVPTSPAAAGRLEPLATLDVKMKKLSSRSTTPPGTPTKLAVERESFKKTLSRSSSEKKTTSAGEPAIEETPRTALRAARQFKSAHESFRLRMFQEQHGLEAVSCPGYQESKTPTVFMTKKRTRENKSVSEFKGGDLNKYTAKTYAIQNGNEVFGESRALLGREVSKKAPAEPLTYAQVHSGRKLCG